MKPDYSYQSKAANIVLENALNPDYKGSVLAGTPGCGKTTISHILLNKYCFLFPNSRIVVLTEGQNLLKDQYTHELENANIPIEFTYGGFKSNAQVKIGIPHSIDQLSWDSIDLLLIDEAHNFYFASMIQSIIGKYKPKHLALMTGSPTKFNKYNEMGTYEEGYKKPYAMHYISARELADNGVFSNVKLKVVRVYDKKDPIACIDAIIIKAKKEEDDLTKIMIACSSISDAQNVAHYLKNNYNRKVSISTSKNDNENIQIKNFKYNKTDTLVVVKKGVLGFNDSNVTALMDLRSSEDLDSSYQLFARILRVHPQKIEKTYYRIADNNFNEQVIFLHKMASLMRKDIYSKYNGSNLTHYYY